VHSLSPPKPAGLDPPQKKKKNGRRSLYDMRKSLGKPVFLISKKKIDILFSFENFF
jgi:hypothetical protein